MKNLLGIALLTGVLALPSCGQENENVPEKVLKTFNAKFPGAKKVDWEMEDEAEWEAEFDWKGKEYSSNFSASGEWMETVYEIKENEIPVTIRDILNENFKEYEIEKVEIAETIKGETYEFELEVGEEEFEVVINLKGEVIKKAKEEDEEADEE